MDRETAQRLVDEADDGYAPGAPDTLGVFLREERDPFTGALISGQRWKVIRQDDGSYLVTVTDEVRGGVITMDEVLVNRAIWDGPEVPDGWVIVNAPRPLLGEMGWTGGFRAGMFYAAAPEASGGSFGWEADDARVIRFITDAEVEERVSAKLAEYGTTLDEVGLTMADMAYDMRVPYVGSPEREEAEPGE